MGRSFPRLVNTLVDERPSSLRHACRMPPSAPVTSSAVYKFGGAALADARAIVHAVRIVARRRSGMLTIVASAMAGVTDELLAIATEAARSEQGELDTSVLDGIARLRDRHHEALASLSLDVTACAELTAVIDDEHDELTRLCAVIAERNELTPAVSDEVAARGERLAARLFAATLAAAGVEAEYLDATSLVHADARHGGASPDLQRTAAAAGEVLVPLLARGVVPVVPGFIGRAPSGAVVTLGRGGSDLTATLLAHVLDAREVVLWKDVPGMLTADPRVVPDARFIPSLHVREASELAYYGARVLHPRALIPLAEGTRLRIRALADPDAPGTEISSRKPNGASARYPVKALAALADQALVTIVGNGMAGVPGIAARAFGALERERISVSLISQASSEHSICMGLSAAAAPAAERALRAAFASEIERQEIDGIEVRSDAATLAIVGLGMAGRPGIAARLFTALADAGVNIVAIAQGASELNISVVVDGADAMTAQRAVHAAFRLDKIGGGAADHSAHADVVVLGYGQVGRELAAGLAALPRGRRVRVVGVIDRSGYVFEARGLTAKRLETLAASKRAGTPLAKASRGHRATAAEAIDAIASHALSRPILVDLTADDTGPVLEEALAAGLDLVLANKRPLAASRAAAERLMHAAAARGRRILHEATVGAGLPIIDTVHKLLESGDKVLKIEGCPSGTLGYLFGELGRGAPFSVALREAMRLGYTEPDPRDDLSGMDVARKALILGRLLGFTGEIADLDVESLVPPDYRDIPLSEFLGDLEQLDAVWAERVESARARDTVLRYRATVTSRRVRVGVVEVQTASSLGSLTGTDNQFAFTTSRYRTNPLVITGPGAGVQVTAAGVVNDVLKLAGMR